MKERDDLLIKHEEYEKQIINNIKNNFNITNLTINNK
jgi:hypothetical protein